MLICQILMLVIMIESLMLYLLQFWLLHCIFLKNQVEQISKVPVLAENIYKNIIFIIKVSIVSLIIGT